MTLPDCPGLMLGASGTQKRGICAKAKAVEEIRHRGRAMRVFLQRQAVDGIEKPRECIRTPAAVAIFAMRQFRDRLESGDLIGWRDSRCLFLSASERRARQRFRRPKTKSNFEYVGGGCGIGHGAPPANDGVTAPKFPPKIGLIVSLAPRCARRTRRGLVSRWHSPARVLSSAP
jgi:hypothetical protein